MTTIDRGELVELVKPGSMLLPGDVVLRLNGPATVTLGRGLRPATATGTDSPTVDVFATCSGVLERAALKYSVVSPVGKRYLPLEGDVVVGTVVKAAAMSYSVNIGAPQLALLDTLAFDGATKHNRPKLCIGDVVFARVLTAHRDFDTELTCCALPGTQARDWVTGEAMFGKLDGGTVVSVSLQHARDLLTNRSPVLSLLGGRIAFEACVGLNGRVWVALAGSNRGSAASMAAPVRKRGRDADGEEDTAALVAIAQCVKESQMDGTAEECAARVAAFFPSSSA